MLLRPLWLPASKALRTPVLSKRWVAGGMGRAGRLAEETREKEKDNPFAVSQTPHPPPQPAVGEVKEACGTVEQVDEEEEMEEMFVMGPKGLEWGGPTRGGRQKEPTRYGDWERKGRCTDFQ